MYKFLKQAFSVYLAILGLIVMSPVSIAGQLIAHKDNPISNLTQKQARRIFLGKTTLWDNRDTIVPCIHNTQSATNHFFYSNIVKKSMVQFERYWNKQLFSGNGVAPKQFATAEEIVNFVKSNKGALCFVDSTENTDLTGSKIVTLDEIAFF